MARSSGRPTVLAALAVIAVWLAAAAAGWSEQTALDWVPASALGAAFVIVALLAVDVVLPIPATVVMAASGAVLGPIAGSAVNAVGLLAGSEAGRLIGAHAWCRRSDVAAAPVKAHRLALTRGMPVFGEAVAVAAGATGTTRRDLLVPAAVGSLVVGSLHAIGGSAIGDEAQLIMLGAVGSGAASLLVFFVTDRPNPGRMVGLAERPGPAPEPIT